MKLITTEDGSNTLFSSKYGESYHSIHGAKTEALHVFIEASGAAERFRQQQPTDILEIGFGLGLNFLLTAEFARNTNTPLNYRAIEFDPVNAPQVARLGYSRWLSHYDLIDLATDALTHPGQRIDSSHFTEPSGRITLEITEADVSRCVWPENNYDCIYLDPFSPDVNPECWDLTAMTCYFSVLRSGGILSTYSAKGSVRRTMLAAGFEVRKLPGPPGKREMLVGERP